MSATNGTSNGAHHANGAAPSSKPATNSTPNTKHSNRGVKRPEVESTFKQYAQLIHAARRPLPTQSGDGSYLRKSKAKSSLLKDLRSMGPRGWGTLLAVRKSKRSGDLIDDKTYIMERVINLVAGLPPESTMRTQLTNAFVKELWDTLPHPSLPAFGDEYMYRSADGSNNNPLFPKLGAANTPYARSIIPSSIQLGALPDPGLIFDSLFAREEFVPHPNGVSSVFFGWASLIIHGRAKSDANFQRWKIETRLLLRTQASGPSPRLQCYSCHVQPVKLLQLSTGGGKANNFRFHNYAAEQLAHINEGGRFNKPRPGLSPEELAKAWAKYDNDLFQTARLVTCGLYINITLYDYVRTIINLTRSNTTWCLDPRVNMRTNATPEAASSGVGNQCSVEFNLAYRWHSCIGQQDERWTEDIYQELFGKSAETITMPDLLMGMKKWQMELPKDPAQRSFAGLERKPDGRFNDDDLVKIMTESIEQIAGSFGPRNVPKALRAVEILGMQQARKWGCGSLNEFRKFFGLKEYTTFEEINSDPYIADQLRHLYEHPDHVELYPGIVAEEPKIPMIPGAGICPTYTLSRAILSDAVALVRGDRFYTTDYHPKNLTNWGFSETHYDLNINQGCMFYKLMLRAFPNHFQPDSIYAHYPMTIPSENRKIFATLGRENHFSWEKPSFIPPRINLTSYLGAKTVLENARDFRVTWGEATGFLFGKEGLNFMLSGDSPKHAKQRQVMGKALFQERWKQQVKEFYEDITIKLLKQKSCTIAGVHQVDITRDVGNLAHVHFASNVFSLPLKTEENPRGIYTEHEMFMIMCVVFTCIFFDLDPAKSFPLRQAARTVAQQLGKIVEAYVKSVKATSVISGLLDRFRKTETALQDYGVHMIRRLLASGLSVSEVAWSQIMPTAGAMVPNQAQVFTQIMDYYLSDEGRIHLPEIQRLAQEDTPESDDKLLHYCMEGIRLNGTFGSYREAATAMEVDDDGQHVSIKAGDKVFVSFVSANRDPDVFPNPNEVRLDRPLDSYIHYGQGPHTCLGRDANMVALTSMLRVVGKLKNLRRAPGPQGELKKIPRPGGFYIYMREDHGSYFVFPMTFKVHFDGELPDFPKRKAPS
ncbi:hypothetical protein UREG_00168 [Uncinocarpus reesii 1704]|uniref:Linoleate diol synthase n=1 Tax=Uncinocarpus reesii (strain UAMH 1704) TaxID=336963 RepID=C4JKV3_UNCRE|nr:uncharacterized protein UREG_00168 [Uncinocarpus reesii 1704]EEP75322.1 hypothetical protein UREG_00168 [Uncinocarpus reesii 1704]